MAAKIEVEKKSFSLKDFIQKENTVGYVFAAPFIIGFLAFTLIPMILSLYYSFTDFNLRGGDWIGLENYVRLFNDDRFINSVLVTLRFVFVSVPLRLAFGLLVAYLLTRKAKGVSFYRALYYLPTLIGGSIAVAIVWRELFSINGAVNVMLEGLGAAPVNWFGDPRMAMWPLILMSIWQFGSSMIIFAAGLKEIPAELYEAAEMDGANKLKSFFKITLPCLSPVILYNLIMQMISAFMTFTQAFVITGGGPMDSTNFYALYVYRHAFDFFNMGYASAMSWVMLVIISIFTVIVLKTSKYWVHQN
ncbi:MAG: sugar ABC transporter permease [Turicibacter sp.]|nr:sugar ABC transporter permease [Turicibacter sp.]